MLLPPPTSYHKDPENLAMKTHTFVKPGQPQFVAASFFVNLFHCDSVIFLPWKASPHGGFSMGNVESWRKGFQLWSTTILAIVRQDCIIDWVCIKKEWI